MAGDLAQRSDGEAKILGDEFRRAVGPYDQAIEMGRTGFQRSPMARPGDQRIALPQAGLGLGLDGVEEGIEPMTGPSGNTQNAVRSQIFIAS